MKKKAEHRQEINMLPSQGQPDLRVAVELMVPVIFEVYAHKFHAEKHASDTANEESRKDHI